MNNRGMTLLEVMVALAIFSVAALSVLKTTNEHLVGLAHIEEKLFATWVAENVLVEQQLEKSWPEEGWIKGDTELAGSTWYWRYRGQRTQDNDFRAIDVEVMTSPKSESPAAFLRSYTSR